MFIKQVYAVQEKKIPRHLLCLTKEERLYFATEDLSLHEDDYGYYRLKYKTGGQYRLSTILPEHIADKVRAPNIQINFLLHADDTGTHRLTLVLKHPMKPAYLYNSQEFDRFVSTHPPKKSKHFLTLREYRVAYGNDNWGLCELTNQQKDTLHYAYPVKEKTAHRQPIWVQRKSPPFTWHKLHAFSKRQVPLKKIKNRAFKTYLNRGWSPS